MCTISIQAMSQNDASQATSKNELREKLKDLVVEKQQVKDQIRETEKQVDRLQNNTNQPE
jgi:predicted nuclease with TOPRIM domain